MCAPFSPCACTQLWPALRSEVLAPAGQAVAPGEELDAKIKMAVAAAACLAICTRAAGPGALDVVALRDPSLQDLLHVVTHAAAKPGSAAEGRLDRQVLSGALLVAAVSVMERG